MNISPQAVRPKPTAAVQPETPVNGADANAPPAKAPPKQADSNQAATVEISNQARAALRAAGASQNDIARVNLTDKNSVTRAIQRARLSHGKPAAKPPSAANSNASASSHTAAAAATDEMKQSFAQSVRKTGGSESEAEESTEGGVAESEPKEMKQA